MTFSLLLAFISDKSRLHHALSHVDNCVIGLLVLQAQGLSRSLILDNEGFAPHGSYESSLFVEDAGNLESAVLKFSALDFVPLTILSLKDLCDFFEPQRLVV